MAASHIRAAQQRRPSISRPPSCRPASCLLSASMLCNSQCALYRGPRLPLEIDGYLQNDGRQIVELPRAAAQITPRMDATAAAFIGVVNTIGKFVNELFCICRHRKLRFPRFAKALRMRFLRERTPPQLGDSGERELNLSRKHTLKDGERSQPRRLPDAIKLVLRDGATCVATHGDAADNVFASVSLLRPSPSARGAGWHGLPPNHRLAAILDARLPWLFDQGWLPAD